MWDHKDSLELKKRISQLSDEELLNMVTEGYEDYRDEALDYAEAELQARGISFSEEETEEEPEEDAQIDAMPGGRDATCGDCGGVLGPAQLFGESEVIIYLIDKTEERFLKVTACSRCGQVRFTVDFETDIAR